MLSEIIYRDGIWHWPDGTETKLPPMRGGAPDESTTTTDVTFDTPTGDAVGDFLATRSDAPADDVKPSDADTPKDDVTPDETKDEPPAPKTDAEIEAAYLEGKPLTRNEIDRLDEIKETRRVSEAEKARQAAFLENLVPNTVKSILEEDFAELGDLNLDPRSLKLFTAALEKRLGSVAANAHQAFGQPYVNLQARALKNALLSLGMSEADAQAKVYGPNATLFSEYIPTLLEAAKSGGVKPADVTPEWVEKHAPETLKAIEQKFHEKWPERGGARPADGTPPNEHDYEVRGKDGDLDGRATMRRIAALSAAGR